MVGCLERSRVGVYLSACIGFGSLLRTPGDSVNVIFWIQFMLMTSNSCHALFNHIPRSQSLKNV